MEPAQDAPARIGRYDLHNVLGRGAGSVVWRATDTESGREVAVKLEQYIAGAEELSGEFRAAVAAISALEHQALAQVFDGGLTEHPDGKSARGLYFAMELFDGDSAAALILQGPVEPRRSTKLVRDICKGVSAAHRRGVLHLDIRPANIFFDGEAPKLCDFSALRPAPADNVEILSRAMGTIGYVAPEQVQGRTDDIDQRTDVYGLCATLSALVTGSPLGDDELLAELRSSWPELVAVLERGLDREPERRYRSATALGLALDEVLGTETELEQSSIAKQGPPWALIGVASLALGLAIWRFALPGSDPVPPPQSNTTASRNSSESSTPSGAKLAPTASSTAPPKSTAALHFDLAKTEAKLAKGDYSGAAADFAALPLGTSNSFNRAERLAWIRTKVGQWLHDYSYHPGDSQSLATFLQGGSLGRDIAELIRTAQAKESVPYEFEVLDLLSGMQTAKEPATERADAPALASAITKSLQKHPGRSELILTAAMYELGLGNASLAREQLRALPRTAKHPARLLLRLLSDLALAESSVPPESFDGLVQRFPVLEADLGLTHLLRDGEGDLPRAIEVLTSVTAAYPNMAAGFHNLAAAQARSGDVNGALATLEKLVHNVGAAGEWDASWSEERAFQTADRMSAGYVNASTERLLQDPWLAPLRDLPGWNALELP